MLRNNSLRDLVFLKLPVWVVPTTCDNFVKRRLGNSFYINVGAVIRVDTHNIRSDDAVLGDWHWFKDIHLLLMVFFSQAAFKITGHEVTSDRRHRCAAKEACFAPLRLFTESPPSSWTCASWHRRSPPSCPIRNRPTQCQRWHPRPEWQVGYGDLARAYRERVEDR